MLVMIDNYDSFTYNIVQYLGELGAKVRVLRNDETDIGEIERLNPSHICISPGPCAPEQAGISIDVIKHFAGKVPILGVCLGHQAIGAAFGGDVVRAKEFYMEKWIGLPTTAKAFSKACLLNLMSFDIILWLFLRKPCRRI